MRSTGPRPAAWLLDNSFLFCYPTQIVQDPRLQQMAKGRYEAALRTLDVEEMIRDA